MLDVTFANDTNDVKVTISVSTESKNMTKVAEALGETIVRVVNGIAGEDMAKHSILAANIYGMLQEDTTSKIEEIARREGKDQEDVLKCIAKNAIVQNIKDKHEGENVKITVIDVEDGDE